MRLLLSVVLLLLLVPTYSVDPRLDLYHGVPRVTVVPVPLDSDDPQRRRLGRLTYLGGVALRGDQPAFGGFSSMTVEGDRFTLLSDGGNFLRFRMPRLGELHEVSAGTLPGGPGTGWSKLDRDSESMTRDPATGQLWVGFEGANAIWRYAPGFAAVEGGVAPARMARWYENLGPESLVRLRNGGFLTIAELWPSERHHALTPAVFFTGDPVAGARSWGFFYRPPTGYRPTDAAELPSGDFLVLNRKFSYWPVRFTGVLCLVPRREIHPGKIAACRELARFEPPIVHDNLEALAVTAEGGRTIVWIASDDNQEWWQRSLLLKFRLEL